jgi:quaternary ammonium compound-resistance protein SugE
VGCFCLGKANETKGVESTYWMLGFNLPKYKYCCIKQLKNYHRYRLCGLDWYRAVGTVLVGIVVFNQLLLEDFL